MKKQILVVKDKPMPAMDILTSLKDIGFGIGTVASFGKEALGKASELFPDLILIDTTPGKYDDGIETARLIHDICDIPVIYVFSDIPEDKIEQIKSTNPFGFVIRPFQDKELLITIEMALYRHKMEEALRLSEERYRTLFENNPIETIIVDRKAVITGYNQEKVKSGNRLPRPGDVMYKDYAGKHRNNMYSELIECIRSGVSKEIPETQYGDKFLYIKISPFPEGAIITSIDITDRKIAERRLSHLATHDPLTGLPNRILFDDRLSLELAHAQRSDKKLSVMLLDLDHFKDINDSWGHTAGDEILKSVGRRLLDFLRKSDSIARMGGDEFLILLPGIENTENAYTIAQKILDAFKEPFIAGSRKLHITLSIGIAIYPDDGTDSATLMKNADIAMYDVKEKGRNGYRRYDSGMSPSVHQKDILTIQ